MDLSLPSYYFTATQIEKTGNSMVYILTQMGNISKTKLLKLLYILDEVSIKNSGLPFLNLDYKVWKYGPVDRELFVDLSSQNPVLFSKYIEKKSTKNGLVFTTKSGVEFCDDEFTNKELETLEWLCSKFSQDSAVDLVAITHREHSPWWNKATEHNVLELLNAEKLSSTDIEIDMTDLIKDDEYKMEIYRDYTNLYSVRRG